jgi:uncharacterized RDD family membrane protein YckC
VKGEIRNDRSRGVQGTRAGFVSQAVAGLADALSIMVLYWVLLVLYGVVVYFVSDDQYRLPQPGPDWNGLLIFVVGVFLLSSAWSGSGRAPGMAVVGLRVVASDGSPLSPRRAFWRAVFAVATFGFGLITVLFSKRNKSLYDMVCGSATVYAWRPLGHEAKVHRAGTHEHD